MEFDLQCDDDDDPEMHAPQLLVANAQDLTRSEVISKRSDVPVCHASSGPFDLPNLRSDPSAIPNGIKLAEVLSRSFPTRMVIILAWLREPEASGPTKDTYYCSHLTVGLRDGETDAGAVKRAVISYSLGEAVARVSHFHGNIWYAREYQPHILKSMQEHDALENLLSQPFKPKTRDGKARL